MKKVLGPCAVLALIAGVGFAAEEPMVRVLTLKNRPAESLVPVLQALAGPDGVVTAAGGRLVVRAAPGALAEIERALAELDVPPRSLWITVRQDLAATASTGAAGVSATVDSAGGRTRTVVTGAFARGGSRQEGADVQRLQVLEGMRAFIHVGRALPVAQTVIVPSQGGPAVASASGYQEAVSGFYVVPYLSGDRVTLEISTAADAVDDRGVVDIRHVATTVSGRLGEWLSVGGAGSARDERRSSVLAGSDETSTQDLTVSLKVEEAR